MRNRIIFENNRDHIVQILPPGTEIYCIADASWKFLTDKFGIGRSLISKKGILKIKGSAAIKATTTPLVAEAMTMMLAVQQMHRLRYKQVAFLGDSELLIRSYYQ
ncbi:hypothetical protein IGI04_000908 [Brassica rapa subsp. trilocularis]|uniref:RNase H type-1 domain-containing protein n=1 Tax=Brassica rapa subsp. trilocularis TaxID=1813537 RepID=A0ABQ7NR44_BRACM|nr:hypothetical protein IGI04_000908 [Brassica rapa subsp. trilocularis]